MDRKRTFRDAPTDLIRSYASHRGLVWAIPGISVICPPRHLWTTPGSKRLNPETGKSAAFGGLYRLTPDHSRRPGRGPGDAGARTCFQRHAPRTRRDHKRFSTEVPAYIRHECAGSGGPTQFRHTGAVLRHVRATIEVRSIRCPHSSADPLGNQRRRTRLGELLAKFVEFCQR